MLPRVSIVIATRNRPALAARLVRAIEQQFLDDFECIVVDDASDEESAAQYATMVAACGSRFVLHRNTENGGAAVARNTGIRLARAEYIAFCDDDDVWIRTDHLSVAHRTLSSSSSDLYFAEMQLSNEGVVENPSWYSALRKHLKGRSSSDGSVYDLTIADVACFLRHRHISATTLVVRRDLFERAGLYWDRLRFAEDHDLSFRLADKARGIKFRSDVCGDVNVSRHPSLARAHRVEERCLLGVLAALHAETSVDSPLLRSVAKANRSWRMLEIAQLLKGNGKPGVARDLTVQSLLISPSARGIRDYFSYLP